MYTLPIVKPPRVQSNPFLPLCFMTPTIPPAIAMATSDSTMTTTPAMAPALNPLPVRTKTKSVVAVVVVVLVVSSGREILVNGVSDCIEVSVVPGIEGVVSGPVVSCAGVVSWVSCVGVVPCVRVISSIVCIIE